MLVYVNLQHFEKIKFVAGFQYIYKVKRQKHECDVLYYTRHLFFVSKQNPLNQWYTIENKIVQFFNFGSNSLYIHQISFLC